MAPGPDVALATPRAPAPPPPLTRGELEEMMSRALARMQAEQQVLTEQAIAKALAEQARKQPQGTPQPLGQAAPPSTQGEPKDKRWFTAKPEEKSDVMAAPCAKDEKEPEGKTSALFPKATWERPFDPTRVIYASQLIHGMLKQGIVTGEASTVRIEVTETLYDRFGQQVTLIPKDARILATVDGTAKRGQTRIKIQVTKVELPDGTDILFTGKVGDVGGAGGVPGNVDNKYGQVALAAVLSTALSIGARAAAGDTTGFNPTVEQEFARDIGQSVNQTGQKVVKDALNVEPEISQKAQFPVTIQLDQNVNLQTPPVIIRK